MSIPFHGSSGIRGIPVKNPPPLKNPPLIDSDFELRGGFLSGPPEAENFQDFLIQNDGKSFRNTFKKHSKTTKNHCF